MKKLLTMVLVLGLLALLGSGCGGERENALSSAPESVVENSYATDKGSETTTTTTWGTTNANCTYPTAPFTVGAAVRVRDEVFKSDFSWRVVTSKAQLDALELNEEHNAEKYTEAFFAEKALVVLEFRLTSGSIQLRIDNVWASGDTMWVRYTTLHPNPFTNDMAYRRILLEISQKDADGIEHIVGERVPIHLPSGSPPKPTTL